MKCIAEKDPSWIVTIGFDKFSEEEMVRIVSFYLFNTPCIELSKMGIDLINYGWQNPWDKPYYLNEQLKQGSRNLKRIYSTRSYEQMSETLEIGGIKIGFPGEYSQECICIFDNKRNQFMSTFYHIRNSIAHGRFAIRSANGVEMFIFEDKTKPKDSKEDVISARMIIAKNTLLKWIEIIEGGEQSYQKSR